MAKRGSAKGERRGGRKPGIPNKITQDMREAVKQAFDRAGGVEYLVKQSLLEPVAFLGLVGKIIPKEVEAKVSGKMVVTWER